MLSTLYSCKYGLARALIAAGDYIIAPHTAGQVLVVAATRSDVYMATAAMDSGVSHDELVRALQYVHDVDMLNLFVEAGLTTDDVTDELFGRIFSNTRAENSGHMIRLLVAAGADLEARRFYGASPLMLAVRHDRIDDVETLINLGANVNTTDDSGDRPLKLVLPRAGPIISQNTVPILKLLLKAGATIHIQDIEAARADIKPILMTLAHSPLPRFNLSLLRRSAAYLQAHPHVLPADEADLKAVLPDELIQLIKASDIQHRTSIDWQNFVDDTFTDYGM